MEYKVIDNFYDGQDENHHYTTGQAFPRSGFVVSQERLDHIEGLGLIEKVSNKLEGLTVTELKAKLDELGIEYDSKAKKQDLINLLDKE